jgi:hypothetical protein
MYLQGDVLLDLYVKQKLEDIYRDVAHDRLVAEAERIEGRRPLRVRLANRLYALAARVEGRPRRLSPIEA